jgi:hypothetical protein
MADSERTSGVGQAGTKREKPDGTEIMVGDCNFDGNLRAADVTFIKRKMADSERTSGVGQAGTLIDVKKAN